MTTELERTRWEGLFAERTRGNDDGSLARILELAGATDVISFAGGIPDPATFPRDVLPELLAAVLEGTDPAPLQYSPLTGLPSVRDFLTERIDSQQGSPPRDRELLVTSGGMEGLQLMGTALLEPGDLALVEAPTYLGAIMAFRSFGARVEAVPLDDDGLVVEALEERLRGGESPKLLYTIPDFQNPSGVSLSHERRLALAELSRRHGLLVLEDVAYRDLSFEGVRTPTLWSLAPDAVLQIGTFSKTFFPGVRLGWAIGPEEVVGRLTWAKQLTDQGAGALGQRLLEEYGRRGLLDAQIIRSRELYATRCRALVRALEHHMPPGASWTRPRGGFLTWLTFPPEHDSVELTERAFEQGVAVVPGVPFYPDGRGRNSVRLSFSRVAEDEIADGIARLGALLEPR